MARTKVKLGARAKYYMIEKVEGARDKSKIRINAERTRVSTITKAKTEALDIAKASSENQGKVNNIDGHIFHQIQGQGGVQGYIDNEGWIQTKGKCQS